MSTRTPTPRSVSTGSACRRRCARCARCGPPTPGTGSWCGGPARAGRRGGRGRWRTAAMSRAGWSGPCLRPVSGWCGSRPSSWLRPAAARAPAGSPTRSTRWPSPGPRCASRACPSPATTSPPASSSCWSTTVRTCSPSAPATRTGCAGICMSSTPSWTCPRAGWTGWSCSTGSPTGWPGSRPPWWCDWPPSCWPTSAP